VFYGVSHLSLETSPIKEVFHLSGHALCYSLIGRLEKSAVKKAHSSFFITDELQVVTSD
jgi:hypothetical protein